MSERSGGETVLAFMLGGLIGGLLGAAAGILFAPASGKETRKKIGETFDEVKDRATELWEDGVEAVKEQSDKIGSAFEHRKVAEKK